MLILGRFYKDVITNRDDEAADCGEYRQVGGDNSKIAHGAINLAKDRNSDFGLCLIQLRSRVC
jgi:hypothetical protein